jgi:hypothetical protein
MGGGEILEPVGEYRRDAARPRAADDDIELMSQDSIPVD